MKPPFHRILPILKGVLVVCGILFVLQWVVGMFFLSQQLGQLDTLSQQLQHSNNHVTGVLSEEGGKGPSTTPADADAVQVATKQLHEATTNRFQEINNEVARSQQLGMKQTKNVIIAVLAVLIVGLIGMGVFPPARGDSSRGVEIKEILKRWAGVALTIKNTLKPWVDVALTIKDTLVVIVGLGYLWLAVVYFTIEVLDKPLGFFFAIAAIAVHIFLGYVPKKIKKALCESVVIVCGLFLTLVWIGLTHSR